MQKTNLIVGIILLLVGGYYVYTVLLADDALMKRTTKTAIENGGYQIVIDQADGSKMIETYEISDAGDPLSHTLLVQGTDPDSEPWIMKKGTFVPKHQ